MHSSLDAPVDTGPAISVLMAVRNGARHLDEAIASTLSQSFEDFELIVVDNGSRDETPAKLADWAAKDSRVRVLQFARPGLARSLNFAADKARGEILARLDADDIAEPDRLSRQYAALAADPMLGAIGTNATIIDDRGRPRGTIRRAHGREAVRAQLATGNPFVHSTMMFRRSLFEQAGRYRDGLRATEDLDLWLRMAEVGELDLLPELLVRYRQHGASLTHTRQSQFALGNVCVRAAVHARRTGQAEPFRSGQPKLRPALALLGLDRRAVRQQIREQLRRERLDDLFVLFPLPRGLKATVRQGLIAIGLKRVYGWIVRR